MDMEFATNQELINELVHRSTFVGCVICGNEEQKFAGQIHKDFRLTTNMDLKNTMRLLDQIRSRIPEDQ